MMRADGRQRRTAMASRSRSSTRWATRTILPTGRPASTAAVRRARAASRPTRQGDFDGDGDVDGADFLAWQRGLGTPQLQGSASTGDADGDRDVDATDLGLFKNNFGAPVTAAIVANSAPEAAASVLAADEWILVDQKSSSAPAKRALRERVVDEAFGQGSSEADRRAWRPAVAAGIGGRWAAIAHDADAEPVAVDAALDEFLPRFAASEALDGKA